MAKKSFITRKPAINLTVVGFGQAGNRVADQFARFTDNEEKQSYNCLALNSNDGDLKDLKYIPNENRYSLGLGGLGKNPEKAMKILEQEEVKEKMNRFISEKIGPKDEVVVFIAGLGGGTGTSTIVKAIEEFHAHHNLPKIKEELQSIVVNIGKEAYSQNPKKYQQQAFLNAKEKFVKIVVIAMLPLRSDGPDVLRQVSGFTQQIWSIAQNPTKGVAQVIFPDNQFFYDKYKEIPKGKLPGIENYRDYANREIANMIHELNTGAAVGDSTVILDEHDLRRIWFEHEGTMIYSKEEVDANSIKSEDDLVELFDKAMNKASLHGPVHLREEKDGGVTFKKTHHVGLFAVVDGKNKYGKGSFLDTAKEKFNEKYIYSGTVFPGYIQDENNGKITVYVFYKTEALPERLAKGLVEEYEEYKKKQESVSFASSEIKTIEKENDLLDLDFGDLGLDDLFTEENKEVAADVDNSDLDIDLDLDSMLEQIAAAKKNDQ